MTNTPSSPQKETQHKEEETQHKQKKPYPKNKQIETQHSKKNREKTEKQRKKKILMNSLFTLSYTYRYNEKQLILYVKLFCYQSHKQKFI